MNNGSEIHLTVNGQVFDLPEAPGEMLSDLLRYRLKMTGTKIGCNEAECGACTVLVDGKAVLSCSYPAAKADGKQVMTIEGLACPGQKADERVLHPLQEAFVKYGAVQCGFCIPGQIMTSYALLANKPEASEAEIRYALKDTLCRCGGYTAIIRAIQAAGKSILSGEPVVGPQVVESSRPGKAVGKSNLRPDAVEKTTGAAIYTDDLSFQGMLHARVKRAMVPSAIVRKIDIGRAQALPGVQAVLTAADIPGETNHGLVIFDWPALVGVGARVRTVGDALAIVAADTAKLPRLPLTSSMWNLSSCRW
jgi:aerobic-type carbon monoxide dehydrogenase small subunit (CoxS/CutS family)